jgi:hypothetical protein
MPIFKSEMYNIYVIVIMYFFFYLMMLISLFFYILYYIATIIYDYSTLQNYAHI